MAACILCICTAPVPIYLIPFSHLYISQSSIRLSIPLAYLPQPARPPHAILPAFTPTCLPACPLACLPARLPARPPACLPARLPRNSFLQSFPIPPRLADPHPLPPPSLALRLFLSECFYCSSHRCLLPRVTPPAMRHPWPPARTSSSSASRWITWACLAKALSARCTQSSRR